MVAVIKPGPGTSDDAAAAHTFSEGDGLTVTDAAQGIVAIDIPAAVTIDPGTWYYKIRVTSAGHTETAVDGNLRIQDT